MSSDEEKSEDFGVVMKKTLPQRSTTGLTTTGGETWGWPSALCGTVLGIVLGCLSMHLWQQQQLQKASTGLRRSPSVGANLADVKACNCADGRRANQLLREQVTTLQLVLDEKRKELSRLARLFETYLKSPPAIVLRGVSPEGPRFFNRW